MKRAALVLLLALCGVAGAQPITSTTGLTKVKHDGSMTGDGTSASPLAVAGGGGFTAAGTGLTASGATVNVIGATGGGLSVLADSIGLLTSCSNPQVLAWNGTAWACSNFVNAAGAGLTLTGSTLSLPNVGPGASSYTYGSFTLDAQGRITAASSGTAPVTSVGVSAPITTTGGLTPTIGIALTSNLRNNGGSLDLSTAVVMPGSLDATAGAASLGQWSAKELSPASFSTQQDNYNPTNLATAGILRLNCTNASGCTITGLQGGVSGRRVRIYNVGSNKITLANQVTSTAANQFKVSDGADFTVQPNSYVDPSYDGTLSRWAVEQAISAGSYGQAVTFQGAVTADATHRVFDIAGTGLTSSTNTVSLNINAGVTQTCGAGTVVNAITGVGITSCVSAATLGYASGTGTAGTITEWNNTTGGLVNSTFPITDTSGALTLGNATTDSTTVNGVIAVTNPPASGNAINSTYAASASTSAPELIRGVHSGTYNTTAGNLQIYAGDFESTSTRSSGANSLINTAMYLDAHGGQTNYAIYSPAGDALFSGVLSTSSTLSVTGLSTLTGGFTAGAASTVNSTLTVSASTDTQITVSPGGGTRAATNTLLNASTAASFNTTSGAMTSYGVLGQVTSTRSAGANTLTNIALYGNASGAQTNYGLYVAAGNSLLSGTLDMSSNKILNCANGTVSSDGACFGQLATAVNAAVSGTSGTSTRFTGTNVVGNGSFLDSGTYVDRAAANGAFFTLNASGTDFGVIANDGGWIEVAGSATAGGSLVNKAMKWNPNTAATDALGTFESTGAATLDSTLGVTGLSTLTGGFSSGAASSVTGALTLTNTVQASERIRFAGQEYLAAAHTDTNGPALLLMVNRASDRRIALVDSSAEALNNSNPQLQFGIDASAAYIDSGSTDATTARTLNINTRITSPLVIGGAVTMNSTASVGGALNMNSHLINNVTDPASAQDVVTLNFLNNNPGSVSGAYLGRQTFSSTGAYTYTPTTGTHKVRVRVCGAGGGGGGVTGSASNAAAGEGGTAGEYQDFFVDGGTSTLITGGAGSVGTGGSAGANTGGAGGTGGDTTLTIQTVLRTSKGGTGGAGMTTGTSIATAQTASDMGTSSTFGSFMTFAYGTPGIRLSGTVAVAGNGGSSPFGRGGHGHASQGGGESGATGGAHCGGGGGGMSTAAAQTGGAGGDGLVIIDEWRLRMLLSGASPANDNTSRFQLPRFTRAPATGLADIRAAM